MLLNVVEGMLSHIGYTQVGVLPHSALCSLQLSGEQLDHGGLAGSVSSNDSHAGVEGDGNADALKDLAGCVGVSACQQRDDCRTMEAVKGQEGGGLDLYLENAVEPTLMGPPNILENMPCVQMDR